MRTTGNHVTDWLLEGSINGNSSYSQIRRLAGEKDRTVLRAVAAALAETDAQQTRDVLLRRLAGEKNHSVLRAIATVLSTHFHGDPEVRKALQEAKVPFP
jgi:HEAT repeat protein